MINNGTLERKKSTSSSYFMDCFMDFIYGIDNVANGVNDYLLMVVLIKEKLFIDGGSILNL